MRYTVRTENLREAAHRLRYQSAKQDEMRSRLVSCLKELRQMSPMRTECKQLAAVVERMQEEIDQQRQMADALARIAETYVKAETRVIENGWGCTVIRRRPRLAEVVIPHYNLNIPIGIRRD